MNQKLLKILQRVIVPIIIFTLSFLLPIFIVVADPSPLLTVISLVFAILVGFFIATATTNYLNFQNHLAQENANLITLFNLCNLVNPSQKRLVADKIDEYLISSLDYPLITYVESTQKEFEGVVNIVDTLKPGNDNSSEIVALENLQTAKVELFKNRESLALAALRVTNGLHWTILIVLASILIFLLFSLRTDESIIKIVIGLLSSAIYFILLLLYEIDGNVFLEEQLAYHDIQKVFRAIDKLPYYPSFAFTSSNINAPEERYRIGVYSNYPISLEKKVEIRN